MKVRLDCGKMNIRISEEEFETLKTEGNMGQKFWFSENHSIMISLQFAKTGKFSSFEDRVLIEIGEQDLLLQRTKKDPVFTIAAGKGLLVSVDVDLFSREKVKPMMEGG